MSTTADRPVIYTTNASERMAEQNISPQEVEEVVNTQEPNATTRGGASIYTKEEHDRRLNVVVEEESGGRLPRTILTLWTETPS